MQEPGRLRALDGLRAVAVFAVIIEHGLSLTGPDELFSWWAPGPAGVRLFFVLSGFLITGILLDARDRADRSGVTVIAVLRAFYLRRTVRIVPVAFLALAVALAVDVPGIRAHAGWYLSYTSNILSAFQGHNDQGLGHFWSLAIEEQFYLLWPVAMLMLPRWGLPYAIGLSLIGPALGRLAVSPFTAYVLLPTRADSLACGAALAWLQRQGLSLRAIWLAAAGLGLVIAQSTESGMILLSAAAIVLAVRGRPRILSARPLAYLGTISYGVYVWHFVLPAVAHAIESHYSVWLRVPPSGSWVAVLWSVAVTVPVAAVSWHFFEAPLTGLKRLWPYVPLTPEGMPPRTDDET